MKNSILFVNPEYHSTFAQSKVLNNCGWDVNIFVSQTYPEKLLYSKKQIKRINKFKSRALIFIAINHFMEMLLFIHLCLKHHFIIYYSKTELSTFLSKPFRNHKSFSLELFLLKYVFGKKLIYSPSGCREEMHRIDFFNIDPNVCSNCGFYDKCDEKVNQRNFNLIKKYFHLSINQGFFRTKYYSSVPFKFKSIDLNLWSQKILVSKKFLLPETKKIRILHSHFLNESERNFNGKNIKGTPFIEAAISKLQNEGFAIEKIILENIPSNEIRFYQIQADIVIDQIIYGHWGSTATESMALGKPVICYMNPVWKKNFLKNFPEYDDLPIVEANTSTIYKVLKELIENSELRKQIGMRSRNFIERHYDPEKNAKILIEQLSALD